MKEVWAAAVGVAASAGVLIGGYALEQESAENLHDTRIECLDTFGEGENLESCLRSAENVHDKSIFEIIKYAGGIGVIGCGYLGYKAVKKTVNEPGLIEDLL